MSLAPEAYRRRRGWASQAVMDPHDLADRLASVRDVVILDVSRDEDDAGYRRRHIPGARFVHWKGLTWLAPQREFPGPSVMSSRLGCLGITDNTTVVISGDPTQFGVYVAWVLKMCGHSRVQVLDGGNQYWLAAGLPLTEETPAPSTAEHQTGASESSMRIRRDELLALLGSPGTTIIDFRTREEYIGERVTGPNAVVDDGAQAKGHIPGARHLFFRKLLEGGRQVQGQKRS